MFFHKTYQRHLFKITIHKFPEEDIVKTIQISFTLRSFEICFTKCLFELLLYNPINCFHLLLHKALNNNFHGNSCCCVVIQVLFFNELQQLSQHISTYFYAMLSYTTGKQIFLLKFYTLIYPVQAFVKIVSKGL